MTFSDELNLKWKKKKLHKHGCEDGIRNTNYLNTEESRCEEACYIVRVCQSRVAPTVSHTGCEIEVWVDCSHLQYEPTPIMQEGGLKQLMQLEDIFRPSAMRFDSLIEKRGCGSL